MKRLHVWMTGALFALCTACVASGGAGGGGGSSGGTDTVDATSAGTDSGSTADGASSSDAGTSADAGTSTADAAGKDGSSTDAVTPGDVASTDAALDAQSGGPDAGPVPTDSGPKPSDGGPAPTDGGPKPVDGGPSGPATCETACKNVAKANCPNDDPFDKCLAGCDGFLKEASKCPPDKVQAFLACASDNVVTCSASGESEPPMACAAVMLQLKDCLGGGGPDPPPPPDPCTMGNCYAGGMDPGNPNAKPQCGCSSNCNGNTIAIDCDGSQCFCSVNGQKLPGFEQGNTCDNPQTAMTAICGKP